MVYKFIAVVIVIAVVGGPLSLFTYLAIDDHFAWLGFDAAWLFVLRDLYEWIKTVPVGSPGKGSNETLGNSEDVIAVIRGPRNSKR